MENVRLFNYPGNKIKYCDQINFLINQAEDVKTYVEPFCGTASVMLNLTRSFDRVVLNDHSKDIMRIIKSFRDGNHAQLAQMYEDVRSEFGDIRTSKESYYNFRNAFNDRYYGKDNVEEGFFLYMASRAAINSLFRVGPKGFNQSFGNRASTLGMTAGEFDQIKEALGSAVLFCDAYDHIMDVYDSKDTIYFLDPPYVDRKVQGSYKDEHIFDQDRYLNIVKNIQGKVVYTDVLSDYIIDNLGAGWDHVVLKNKKNVSPGRNREKKIDYVEVAYFNFRINKID